ncbi:ATP-binding protein [Nonomuraea guangzhouensis]|uniref:histidine kinase n=1 Tax=Nonomuraea guangzhouensis TaxID=1291555 RepID=A0ABW4GYQ6_9ACTN|nr:ATP-binding protein [Nonomuraea guangzhouensis]
MGLASVRLRATAAATLVVAVALGLAALVLVMALRGSLRSSADEEAARKAVAAAPYAQTIALSTEPRQGATGLARTSGELTTTDFVRACRAPATTRKVRPSSDTATTDPVRKPGEPATTGKGPTPDPATTSKVRPSGEPTATSKVHTSDGPTVTGPARPCGEPATAGKVRSYSDMLTGRTADADGVVRMADLDVMITATRAVPVGSWAEDDAFAVAGMPVSTSTGSGMLWARASLAGADQALATLNGALLPGVPALLLVVAGMTWFSVGRTLAPVAAIRAKVADITARDLHQRVPVPRSGDEIAALATTVNGTLDRLETAVETHKRFVADAAHELRSPIATLRARLELAEPTELTAEALADVDRLQSLAADLLLLAKLDAGEPLRTGDLDLGQVAAEESLRIKRRPELRMELDVEPDVVFQGSRAHLARLVTNLVDNAVRHAATFVRVRVHGEDGQAVLRVLDDGPGIPEGEREAVFDRFTRLDEARARDVGGAGLGLPIARDIASLHGGTLIAEEGGFIARFPLNH